MVMNGPPMMRQGERKIGAGGALLAGLALLGIGGVAVWLLTRKAAAAGPFSITNWSASSRCTAPTDTTASGRVLQNGAPASGVGVVIVVNKVDASIVYTDGNGNFVWTRTPAVGTGTTISARTSTVPSASSPTSTTGCAGGQTGCQGSCVGADFCASVIGGKCVASSNCDRCCCVTTAQAAAMGARATVGSVQGGAAPAQMVQGDALLGSIRIFIPL